MELSREEVLHIAHLAKLGLNDDEVNKLSEELSHILESFVALQQVDTKGVPPTAQPNPLNNILKEDKIKPSLTQDEVLINAPNRENEFFRVKAVLE
ncbi:MAG: Asp-tRNA(Asn)/Glu-tRNA(Gln) amidotransferase subunit GatC [Dehalococcoidia bacterium]|nr:MAG: Asp-tRNA(Asn)/Glu-tRNA(Gln) amidotransferase subunit GatC [Dehalococcoidia bacterium]